MSVTESFEIVPHEGVGPLRFGMSQNEIRAILGYSFRSNTLSEGSLDHYTAAGIFVHYREGAGCEAIEMYSPTVPTFDGKQLLARPFCALEQWAKSQDPDLILDDAGFRSNTLGLGVYAPAARIRPDENCESVLVFERGYYERF